MVSPHIRAPHAEPGRASSQEAPNAALLIDFDNVTMGMRSDLAKELKHLLESDIIKGKVTVQRAYADWRRYPQYIVPLSEASIDLIFAPAYGSSKKNATDIRMAIDGMELVFIRPEIGTFILLTGDSDFSSLVLKLKEYGKYVIGIGIQESSSDILVQNCDEYYSYTSLTGLSKASEGTDSSDAWHCVEQSVARMVSRGDVMRSDRLKQVMIEISPTFDERQLGFKNFSKFLAEAAKKGLVKIRRAENGQFIVTPVSGAGERASKSGGRRSVPKAVTKEANDRRSNEDNQSKRGRRESTAGGRGQGKPARGRGSVAPDTTPALELLRSALGSLGGKSREGIRDSEVKRLLLSRDRDFNEGAFGFAKFSKFLLHAEEEGVVDLERLEQGSFQVRLANEKARRPAKDGRVASGAAHREGEPDLKELGLPTSAEAMTSYLINNYGGIGVKTAEALMSKFGTDLFMVLRDEPKKILKVLRRDRAKNLLSSWEADYERRKAKLAERETTNTRATGSRPGNRREQKGRPRRSSGRPPQRKEPATDTDSSATEVVAAPAEDKPESTGVAGLLRRVGLLSGGSVSKGK